MFWFRRSVHPEADLSAYLDGELGERARRAVETHLAGCEACSTLLRELQDTKSLLSELPRLEPRRSLALGPEFAAERRPAPAPRRATFSFAPAVALTVLVALLVVDAANFSSSSSNDAAFSTASGGAGSEAAGAGLAMEAARAAEEPNAAQDSTAGGSTAQDGSDGAGAAGGAAGAAELAPPSESPLADEAPQPMVAEDEDVPVSAGPEDTSLLSQADDSSGGLSTLRILQIAAAVALAVSLLAVFLPRIAGRSER